MKVGDVIRAKYRTRLSPGDADETEPEFPQRGMYWLGVVHAVRTPGWGRKAWGRTREVDVLWTDGILTTELGVVEVVSANHVQNVPRCGMIPL